VAGGGGGGGGGGWSLTAGHCVRLSRRHLMAWRDDDRCATGRSPDRPDAAAATSSTQVDRRRRSLTNVQ